MISTSVVAVGLPEAGKSSFIAALGYLLRDGDDSNALQLDHLAEDMSYLNSLIDDWLAFRKLDRTKGGVHKLSFSLKDKNVKIGNLLFPDISGETYEQHWALREWEQEYSLVAETSTGVLLFIHPSIEKPYTFADEARVARAAGDEEGPSTEPDAKPLLWDPVRAAPQVKLVDFLQMIVHNTTKPLPLRLCIIVSAWDLVLKVNKNAKPSVWLGKLTPLLDQYIRANPESFQYKIFGVSAQGGDLTEDGPRLQGIDEPSARIIVAEDGSQTHDLTELLKWALAGND